MRAYFQDSYINMLYTKRETSVPLKYFPKYRENKLFTIDLGFCDSRVDIGRHIGFFERISGSAGVLDWSGADGEVKDLLIVGTREETGADEDVEVLERAGAEEGADEVAEALDGAGVVEGAAGLPSLELTGLLTNWNKFYIILFIC